MSCCCCHCCCCANFETTRLVGQRLFPGSVVTLPYHSFTHLLTHSLFFSLIYLIRIPSLPPVQPPFLMTGPGSSSLIIIQPIGSSTAPATFNGVLPFTPRQQQQPPSLVNSLLAVSSPPPPLLPDRVVVNGGSSTSVVQVVNGEECQQQQGQAASKKAKTKRRYSAAAKRRRRGGGGKEEENGGCDRCCLLTAVAGTRALQLRSTASSASRPTSALTASSPVMMEVTRLSFLRRWSPPPTPLVMTLFAAAAVF